MSAVHLTTRAVEWLRAEKDPVSYTTKIATYACGAGRGNDTVRVADIRASVRGYPQAKDYTIEGAPFFRPIRHVTCHACIVIMERELETTKQRHSKHGGAP